MLTEVNAKDHLQAIFTLCSNNYLAYARVLGNSVKQFHPESAFYIVLVDELSTELDYGDIGFNLIPIRDIEPEIDQLAAKYDIVELNTCVKPAVFKYLFERTGSDNIIYLDPDTKLFAPLQDVKAGLETTTMLLTPHIETPIPLDRETPSETHFLNYGIYNLGFIAVARSEESNRFLNWWKERTYSQGYSRVADGLFVDQLYINLVPLFFSGAHILKHQGYNMGPWNLHERSLSEQENGLSVNGRFPLVFYHFSSFKPDSLELPVHHYSRYTLERRPDLKAIYQAYNTDLKLNRYFEYNKVTCHYAQVHAEAIARNGKHAQDHLPLPKKIIYSMIARIPRHLRKRLSNLLLGR